MLPYSSVLLIVIDGGLKIWCQKIFSQFMVVLCGVFFLLNIVISYSYFIQTGEK